MDPFSGVRVASDAPASPYPPVATGPSCTDVSIPITVSGAANAHIFGVYCTADGGAGRPIQILVHGVTYTHAYFDLPGFDGRYSYVKYMNDRGYDTLAIDRLGAGQSTRPLLALNVNAGSNASALHQVVQHVRGCELGRTYEHVVLTGHSYGTFTSDSSSSHLRRRRRRDRHGLAAATHRAGSGRDLSNLHASDAGPEVCFEYPRPELRDHALAPAPSSTKRTTPTPP